VDAKTVVRFHVQVPVDGHGPALSAWSSGRASVSKTEDGSSILSAGANFLNYHDQRESHCGFTPEVVSTGGNLRSSAAKNAANSADVVIFVS
jgi:hypothetical protein